MFILPPRIRVNIRQAALLYTVSVSQNILPTSHPSPLEVLEMLMVMGLRYANSELQIQHYAAANTDGGGQQQIRREDREQIMLQANLR